MTQTTSSHNSSSSSRQTDCLFFGQRKKRTDIQLACTLAKIDASHYGELLKMSANI